MNGSGVVRCAGCGIAAVFPDPSRPQLVDEEAARRWAVDHRRTCPGGCDVWLDGDDRSDHACPAAAGGEHVLRPRAPSGSSCTACGQLLDEDGLLVAAPYA